jgi:hypothetical protein
MKNDAVRSGEDIDLAQRRINSLLEMVSLLRKQESLTGPALDNLKRLEQLANGLANENTDLAQAIESLDELSSFRRSLAREIERIDALRATIVNASQKETLPGNGSRPATDRGNDKSIELKPVTE